MISNDCKGANIEDFKVDGQLVVHGKVTVSKPTEATYSTLVIFKAENSPHFCFVPVRDIEAFAIFSAKEVYDGYDCPVFVAENNDLWGLADHQGVVKLTGIKDVLQVCLDKIEMWKEVSVNTTGSSDDSALPRDSMTPPGSPPPLSTSSSSTSGSEDDNDAPTTSGAKENSTQALMARLIKLTKEALETKAIQQAANEEMNVIRAQIDEKLRMYHNLVEDSDAEQELLQATDTESATEPQTFSLEEMDDMLRESTMESSTENVDLQQEE